MRAAPARGPGRRVWASVRYATLRCREQLPADRAGGVRRCVHVDVETGWVLHDRGCQAGIDGRAALVDVRRDGRLNASHANAVAEVAGLRVHDDLSETEAVLITGAWDLRR